MLTTIRSKVFKVNQDVYLMYLESLASYIKSRKSFEDEQEKSITLLKSHAQTLYMLLAEHLKQLMRISFDKYHTHKQRDLLEADCKKKYDIVMKLITVREKRLKRGLDDTLISNLLLQLKDELEEVESRLKSFPSFYDDIPKAVERVVQLESNIDHMISTVEMDKEVLQGYFDQTSNLYEIFKGCGIESKLPYIQDLFLQQVEAYQQKLDHVDKLHTMVEELAVYFDVCSKEKKALLLTFIDVSKSIREHMSHFETVLALLEDSSAKLNYTNKISREHFVYVLCKTIDGLSHKLVSENTEMDMGIPMNDFEDDSEKWREKWYLKGAGCVFL
jgi:hypothetical protein